MGLCNAIRAQLGGALLFFVTSPLALNALAQDYLPGDKFAHDLPGGAKGPEMVVIRPGTFAMGGGRIGERAEELVIEIEHPFAISTTEITVGMYRRFLKASQSGDLSALKGTADNLPVSEISWDQAEAFVSWLSHQTGQNYRLPSSTQWEYAARAGSTKTYTWGDEVGQGNANCTNCGAPYEGSPAPVASFKPNAWGLYDVHGNVWEWTKDCMDANSKPPLNGMPQLFGNCESRELRGGSAKSDAWSIRLNARASFLRQSRSPDVGMRVVMQLPR
jgi:formylglycine-generating enzyme required for sulfatase activity